MKKPKHPMQPLVWDGDVIRFRENKIVRYLLDNGGIDLEQIGSLSFDQDDREQFAQLIGYSVSGFGDLSYASLITTLKADTEAAKMIQRREKRR